MQHQNSMRTTSEQHEARHEARQVYTILCINTFNNTYNTVILKLTQIKICVIFQKLFNFFFNVNANENLNKKNKAGAILVAAGI